MLKKLLAAAALATMAASACAAEPGSIYVGGDVGNTRIDGSNHGSIGAFAGYRFNQTFAVEAGYRRLQSSGFQDFSGQADQAALSLIGSMPLKDGLSLYGRLGANRIDVKAEYAGDTFKANETKPLVGVGAAYDFGNKISGRVELQRASGQHTNLSVGLGYTF